MPKRIDNFTPRIGMSVRCDEYPGIWSVWSQAPDSGTWWLFPYDAEAKAAGRKFVKVHQGHLHR